MRWSGVMDADDGVAVAPLFGEWQIEVQRSASVTLGHDTSARCEHRGQCLRELPPELRGASVRRVEEDEIVCLVSAGCRAERQTSLDRAHLGLDPEGGKVGADRLVRLVRAVHE